MKTRAAEQPPRYVQVLRLRWPGWAGLLAWSLVLLFVAWPLLQLVLQTMTPTNAGGGFLQSYREAFSQPVALSAVWGTLWLTALSLLLGVPLAVLLAWITSSTDAPLARPLAILPTLTLALSPLVGAIGWLVMTAPRVGSLNLMLRSLFGLNVETGPLNAYSLPMIVMLTTFYVVPYVYGPTYAAFRQVDASLNEAARACGASETGAAWTIILPLLRPAILAGALIGGVMVAAMFAIPLILSGNTGLHVIPTEIYHYLNQEGRPAPAMALASLLSAATIVAMVAYLRLLARGRFVTVSGKGSRPMRVRLGVWRWPATLVLLLFLLLAMVLPLLSLLHLSLVDFWSREVFSLPLSFQQYRRMAEFPQALEGLRNSGWLSAVAATLALALGALLSYRRARMDNRANRVLAFVGSLPLGIPSIVIGLAFLVSFTGGWLPLYGTALIMILAYAVHVLPIGMRNCEAGLMQMSPELEEAGLVCGDSRRGVIIRIVAPLLRRPLVTAWGLIFIILFRDISISILLYTPATIPSSVALLAMFDQGSMPTAAAYANLVTLISAVVVALILLANTSEEPAR